MQDILPQSHSPEATSPPAADWTVQQLPERVDCAVLVVDIDRAQRDKLQGVLFAYGIMAIATSSELRALELLRNGGLFDAVLIESGEPQGTGSTLLRQIRRQRPELPIVVLLDDDPERRASARLQGAFCCIAPTSSTEDLAAALRIAVERTRKVRLQNGSGMRRLVATNDTSPKH